MCALQGFWECEHIAFSKKIVCSVTYELAYSTWNYSTWHVSYELWEAHSGYLLIIDPVTLSYLLANSNRMFPALFGGLIITFFYLTCFMYILNKSHFSWFILLFYKCLEMSSVCKAVFLGTWRQYWAGVKSLPSWGTDVPTWDGNECKEDNDWGKKKKSRFGLDCDA